MVGDAYVLWFAPIRSSMKGMERDPKVGVGVFDHCYLLANDDIKR